MGMDRLTLLDIARQADPDGKPAQIVEVLNENNPILQDAPAFPSNAQMGNRVTLRSTLPTVAFSKVNQGYTRSKGSMRQTVDTIAIVAGLSEVDSKLKKIVGEEKFNAARWNEDAGFIESMSQLIAKTIIYGDESVDESAFTGLKKRMASLTTAASGPQVISYGSDEELDITSLYVVDWGKRGVHLIYPEHTIAGIDSRDLGEQRVTDADSNPMMAYVTAYDWMIGLSVEDPRHMGRLANIDFSDAAADTSFTLGLKLIDLLNAMIDPGACTRVLYCHKTLRACFFKQALNKANAALSIRDYLGRPTPYFWEYPIRTCDQFLADEAVIT